MRRARAAALRPAATPPMTTSDIAALFLFPHLLHEIENVEGLDLPVGVVAANGVLLVGEDFEDGGELGHDKQLDVAAAEVHQLDVAAGFAEARRAHDEGAEAGGVDEVDFREFEDEIAVAVRGEARAHVAKGAGFRSDADAAGELENDDAFAFALVNIEWH